MNEIYRYCFNTPIGKLYIESQDEFITSISFRKPDYDITEKESIVIKKTIQQINEYFEGIRSVFDIPLKPDGTDFQKKVWQALQSIPYGETRSYKQIAEVVGNPKACRAVGMANNKNPIPIIIPCHRVIGSSGKLVGYAGGLDIKMKLLAVENTILP